MHTALYFLFQKHIFTIHRTAKIKCIFFMIDDLDRCTTLNRTLTAFEIRGFYKLNVLVCLCGKLHGLLIGYMKHAYGIHNTFI